MSKSKSTEKKTVPESVNRKPKEGHAGSIKITMLADATLKMKGAKTKEYYKGQQTVCTETEFKSLEQSAMKGHKNDKEVQAYLNSKIMKTED